MNVICLLPDCDTHVGGVGQPDLSGRKSRVTRLETLRQVPFWVSLFALLGYFKVNFGGILSLLGLVNVKFDELYVHFQTLLALPGGLH